jgi:hypothetical protein
MFNGLNNKLANVPTITGLSDITADSVTTDTLIVDGNDISSIIDQVPINTANIATLQQITTGQTYASVGDTTTFDNNVTLSAGKTMTATNLTATGTTNLAITNVTGKLVATSAGVTWLNGSSTFISTTDAGTLPLMRLVATTTQTFIQAGATNVSGSIADIVFSSMYAAAYWATINSTGLTMHNTNITLGASSNLILSSPATTLTPTELSYLDGATSNIQAQINAFPTAANIVTTNTTQTISAAKTFSGVTTTFQTNAFSPNTTVSIRDTGTTNTINFYPNAGVGAFNFLTQAGDTLILAGNNALEVTNLTIAPYSNVLSGIRITPFTTFIGVGGVGTGTTRTAGVSCSGTTVTVTGTLVATNLTGLASNATQIAVAENNTNTTFYPTFVSAGAGQKSLLFDTLLSITETPLSYVPSTSTLTCAILNGRASEASQVLVTDDNTASTYYPTFCLGGANGQKSLLMDATTNPLSYVPSTSTLSASNFTAGTNVTTPNILSLTSITPSNSKSVLFNGTPIGNGGNTSSVCMGTNAGPVGTAPNNCFCFGTNAGANLTSGVQNLFIGANSGAQVTQGRSNVGVGPSAMRKTTTGTYNTQIGAQSQSFPDENLIGSYNTTIGAECYIAVDGLSYSTAIGAGVVASTSNTVQIGRSSDNTIFDGTVNVVGDATFDKNNILLSAGAINIGCGVGDTTNLFLNSVATGAATSVQNTCVGKDAGKGITTGLGANVFVGYRSGFQTANGTGSNNVCIGTLAGTAMTTTANSNVMVGAIAGDNVTTGVRNTLLGGAAADAMTSGNDNTVVGQSAGSALLTGLRNTIIGASSGTTITGSDNICIGSGADVPTAAGNNQIAIGRVNETMFIRGGFNLRVGAQIVDSTTGNLSAAGFVLAQFYTVNPAGAGVVIALPNPTNAAYRGAMVTFKRKQVTTAFTISSGGGISFVPIGAVGLVASPISIGTGIFQVTLVSDGVNWCIINQA